MTADYSREVTPRPLTAREAAILDFMLTIDDPRLAPLRNQARTVTVTGACTCGCATIDLTVDRKHATAAAGLGSPVTESRRRTPYTSDEFSELILFLDDGWLSSLEIVWYGTPIPEFPPPSEFEPATLYVRPELSSGDTMPQ